jgi:hypothetical protein
MEKRTKKKEEKKKKKITKPNTKKGDVLCCCVLCVVVVCVCNYLWVLTLKETADIYIYGISLNPVTNFLEISDIPNIAQYYRHVYVLCKFQSHQSN